MLDLLIHRYLRVPYTLNVRHLQKPKKARATILFIHGIGNTGDAWDDVIKKMPVNVRIITIDLLGFGDSPNPKWAIYDAKTQARSVLATLLRLRITTPVIVVGHSLGSLVAIEMAKRYPLLINRLILCSPPLYDNRTQRLPRTDDLLRQMYNSATEHPDKFLRIATFAMKYQLINKTFNVTSDNVDSYMAALRSMIINQTSLQDAHILKVPTMIIRGTLDPVVIAKNLNMLKKANPSVTVKAILSGHEVKGLFVHEVVRTIGKQLDAIGKTKKSLHTKKKDSTV